MWGDTMNFEKKLVILSGKSGKGTALIERNGMGTFLTLNTFSLPDLHSGEYAVGVKTRETVFRREVGSLGRVKSRFALPESDYSAVHLVIFRTDDEEVVLYGASDAPRLWEANVMDGLRSVKLEKKTDLDTRETAAAEAAEFDYRQKTVEDYFLEIDPTRYRDNAVATRNYFEFKEYYDTPQSPSELERKYLGARYGEYASVPSLSPKRKESETGAAETRNEFARAERLDVKNGFERPEKLDIKNKLARTEKLDIKKASSYTVEEAVAAVKTDTDFYATVKPEIDKLFASCEKFEPLERALPDTRWVKVDYDSSGRYYAVGLVGSAPDCIAYGVPGRFAEPSAALGGADFVPVEGLKSAEGFWVLFQSAVDGKELKREGA